MSEAWEFYTKVTLKPLESAPLCVHALGRARARLAADLLALIEQDCTDALSLSLRRSLAHAVGVVRRLQGALEREGACGCKPCQDTEEEGEDATAPDSDDC
jgi:hypothetical protein